MQRDKEILIRVTTVPISMNILLKKQLRFMSDYFEVIGVSSYDTKHFEEIESREGIQMRSVAMTRSITPLLDLISLWRMYRLFKKVKPSIVHSHTPKAGLIAMVAAALSGVPVRLHTLAGLPLMESKGVKRSLLALCEKVTYSCAHRIYPNSLGLFNVVLKMRLCNSDKLKLIGNGSSNGIDTKIFDPEVVVIETGFDRQEIRKSFNIPDEVCVFCFVGRLVKDKGIKELIEAFMLLCRDVYYDSRLLLIGPMGSEGDNFRKYIEHAISLNPRIIYAGRQDDIRPYLAASDIFVFPSYREGFPNVVLQAGAMGLPCIVTDIPGSNEIIINNQNGLIVHAKDNEQLYKTMFKLLIDPELRNSLAKNARQMIINRYQQKPLWEALLQEYKTLLENNLS